MFGSQIAIPIRIDTLVTRNLKHAKKNKYLRMHAFGCTKKYIYIILGIQYPVHRSCTRRVRTLIKYNNN